MSESITWDPNGGIPFNQEAKTSCLRNWAKLCPGITLSGGDPLHPANRLDIRALVHEIRENFQRKQSGCTPDICGNRSAILK